MSMPVGKCTRQSSHTIFNARILNITWVFTNSLDVPSQPLMSLYAVKKEKDHDLKDITLSQCSPNDVRKKKIFEEVKAQHDDCAAAYHILCAKDTDDQCSILHSDLCEYDLECRWSYLHWKQVFEFHHNGYSLLFSFYFSLLGEIQRDQFNEEFSACFPSKSFKLQSVKISQNTTLKKSTTKRVRQLMQIRIVNP